MHDLIDLLERKHLVWHGRDQKAVAGLAGFSSKSGYASLDEKLEGGLPKSGVVSFNSPFGIGELRLLVPTMLSKEHLHVFINPPGNLNAEFLHHQGFDLNLIFIIHTKQKNDALWSAEQCLKSGACSTVLLWQNHVEVHQVKRLQLASETGTCLQFLLRSTQKNSFSLPVTLNAELAPHRLGIETTITKRKGGWPIQAFTIDMSAYWPSLTQRAPGNLIPFPTVRSHYS
jgi:cell division inhibitor SulA